MQTNLEPPSRIIAPQERRLAQAMRHRPTQFLSEFPKVIAVSPRPAWAEGGFVGPMPPAMASYGQTSQQRQERFRWIFSEQSNRPVKKFCAKVSVTAAERSRQRRHCPQHDITNDFLPPESTRESVVEELVHIRPSALGPFFVRPNVAVNERDTVLQGVRDRVH